MSETPVDRVKGGPKFQQFWDLKDAEAGKPGFVIGNGYSCSFYNTQAMRNAGGILIGCNEGFKLHPLHYLVWQDMRVNRHCAAFEGIKVVSRRTLKRDDVLDPKTTFLYEYGRAARQGGCTLYKMHTGGLALQVAAYIGCNPIFLVGCDCCIFQQGKIYKCNMFRDRQGARVQNSPSAYPQKFRGKLTTPLLKGFAQRFESLKNKIRQDVEVYKLGDFGVLDFPVKDFKEFWNDEHPGKGK